MKKDKKSCDLKSCFMCQFALNDWKPSIDNHRKNILFKKGAKIITEGEEVNGIYFVYSGKVKVHKKWGEKEIIVRFASNGAIVGHRGLSTKYHTFPISATALEPTLVCFIELDFFLSTLKINADLTYNLMMFYADELHESEQRMRNLAHMSAKGRLALALIKLAEQFGLAAGGCIDFQLSKQDLASFVGTTYETTFRTLNELIKEELIATDGKQIIIKDLAKLTLLTTQVNKSQV
jgi:CRP-like cAMP-binding protein